MNFKELNNLVEKYISKWCIVDYHGCLLTKKLFNSEEAAKEYADNNYEELTQGALDCGCILVEYDRVI